MKDGDEAQNHCFSLLRAVKKALKREWEIFFFLGEWEWDVKVQHIQRDENGCADIMARNGRMAPMGYG